MDQFDVQEPAFQRHERAARFGRTAVVNHLGQVAAAASRRSQQHDVGPRGGRHFGLGTGPPHGRRNADDPLDTVTQGRLLPEPLQLLVKFLRFAALRRRDFAAFSPRVLRIDQGDDAQNLIIGPAEGHETGAAKERLLDRREPGHVGRNFTAFQNGRRRTKPCGRRIEAGQLVAGIIDALPPEQFFRVGPQPVAAGLVQVDDRQGIIEHIERLRGPTPAA